MSYTRKNSWIPNNYYNLHSGGGGWIRTNVGVSQQIYSLPPLATRAPLRRELMIMREQPTVVKARLTVPNPKLSLI
ncbi:conserved protein of unknown function [Paraburkholderia dioscoreae]|uniref:Uncharacterized protein n=1 Tax=Paraburkholderia dioscoreae TaxID=2604047 RepID=A0A5Q4ZGZ0_9BURK|nr:conserved protein of unknown function [Paraburkholderia dioscoreae]